MGLKSLLRDMGLETKVTLKTDASAAKGIATRKGLGRVRHIEVNQLWLQDRVATGDIQVIKVKGTTNLADALTKPVDGGELKQHSEWMGLAISKSRHKLMPATQSEQQDDASEYSEEGAI